MHAQKWVWSLAVWIHTVSSVAWAQYTPVLPNLNERLPPLMREFYLQREMLQGLGADLLAVESGRGLRAPRVSYGLGPFGSGKTTALDRFAQNMQIPLHRIHVLLPNAGVDINFDPIFNAQLPVDGSNLLGLIVVDEVMNLLPWKDLEGVKLSAEELSQGGAGTPTSAFWNSQKGRRMKMWMDLHDILGSGRLRIDAAFLQRRGINYDILTQLTALVEQVSNLSTALQAGKEAVARLEGPKAEVLARRDALQRELDQSAEISSDLNKKLNEARTKAMAGTLDKTLSEAELTAAKSELASAEVEIAKAKAKKEELMRDLTAATHSLADMNQKIANVQSQVGSNAHSIAQNKTQIVTMCGHLRNFHPDYLNRLFNGDLSAAQAYEKLYADPQHYAARMKEMGNSMPPTLQIDRQNFLIYFLGNPQELLDEVARRFRASPAKDPDALYQIVSQIQDRDQRVQKELVAKLGLDAQQIYQDPEVPEALKATLVQVVGQAQSRLQISGVKFQMPPRTADYKEQLKIWLQDFYSVMRQLQLRDSRVSLQRLAFQMDEASFQAVFDTVIDSLGAIRKSSSNFESLRGALTNVIYSGLAELSAAGYTFNGRGAKRIKAVNLVVTDTSRSVLGLRAEFLDAQGNVVMERQAEFSKPAKSWEEQSTVNAQASSDQTALHQAAHLVVGMHYFGSAIPMDLDFSSEEIGRSVWASRSFDSNLILGHIGTLLAGSTVEGITQRGTGFLPESNLATADARLVRSQIAQLIHQTRLASTQRQDTLRSAGLQDSSPLAILARRLGLDAERMRATGDQEKLVQDAMVSEVVRLLRANEGLVQAIAQELDQRGAISRDRVLELLNSPQMGTPAYSGFSKAEVERIASTAPGMVSTTTSLLCARVFDSASAPAATSSPSGERSFGEQVKELGDEINRLLNDLGFGGWFN